VSSDKQIDGDGRRRQEDRQWETFAKKNGLKVHPRFLFDPGLSGFTAENFGPKGQLGMFLAKVEARPEQYAGDCLGCECWDRISKAPAVTTMTNLMRFLSHGVHLGDVKSGRLLHAKNATYDDIEDFLKTVRRGYEGSSTTSDRCREALEKRARLAEAGELIHVPCLPCWIRAVKCDPDDKGARLFGSLKKPQHVRLELKEKETATIRLVLELARQGKHAMAIVAEMTRRGNPSPGGKRWSAQWVGRLLKDRRLLGEGRRQARADPREASLMSNHIKTVWIPDYYPPVCKEGELLSLSPGRRGNLGFRGRDAEFPNPFKGLIVDPLSGSRYAVHLADTRNGKRRRSLVTRDSRNGRGESKGFDYQAFEQCVLDKLREIDPQSIIGESKAAQEIGELSGRLRANIDEVDAINADMDAHGFTVNLGARVRKLEAKQEELREALALAQHREENPLAEIWGEQQSILATLQAASDPKAARLHLRARLRETIERIWLLVVPLHRARIAAVQIDFVTGGQIVFRHYLIRYNAAINLPHYRRPSSWEVFSWTSGADWRGINLASPDEAAALGKVLASNIDLAKFMCSHSGRK
jgi:hypothetical protein